MLNRREIDRQRVHIILHVNVRNVKKVMDDIVRAASHTHTSAGCTRGSAVLSRKILIRAKNWIGTLYRQILNIK